jgi:hypothetical protein
VTTPGTGVTLTAPVHSAHAAGEAIASAGITFTPVLSGAHSSGASVNELGLKEPALDTPMPAYWGFVLASLMTAPGANLNEVSPSSPTVLAFSSYLSGTESICLINIDDENPVTLQVTGLGRSGTLKTYEYGLGNPAIVEGTTSVGAGIVLAPESVKVLVGSVGASQPSISVHVGH